MKRRYIQIEGKLYEVGHEPHAERTGPDIMPDIEPYRSMIDGRMITSRSQHREHLRDNNCVEVGNEALKAMDYYKRLSPDVAPQQRRELIRAQIDAMTHDEFKRAIKRDADRVKWNSRD